MKTVFQFFKSLLTVGALSAVTLSSAFAAQDTDTQSFQKQMQGHWKSIACELRPQAGKPGEPVKSSWITRDFTFDGKGKFKGTIVIYADQFCEVPMNEFNFSGHTEIGEVNKAAPGARDITYILDESLSITPKSQMTLDMMAQLPPKACGDEPYRLNAAQNILKKSCVMLNNIGAGEVVKDHDLIYLHGKGRYQMLFMGAKHVDGSGFYKPENRPKSGLQVPMVRVK
jgi:hypothetical protein